MGVAGPLVLVANPGSASRKYALFEGAKNRADLHFEHFEGRVIGSLETGGGRDDLQVDFSDLAEAASHVENILRRKGSLAAGEKIERIGLRIVAPGSFFLSDHLVSDKVIAALEAAAVQAPIHARATLDELHRLQAEFPGCTVAGISDSAFHATKPERAWNYGLPIEDADRLEIKRFGYHGISAASVVDHLRAEGILLPKIIIAHLGSGASITAVRGGLSIDNTMGYSPLEGLVMATRSGSIDAGAALALKRAFDYDDRQLSQYLNRHGGLLGLGGSSDIRELLRRESAGDHKARLALETYVYNAQKAIGGMVAALGGAEAVIFTGTVGERSAEIRRRVMAAFEYLHFMLDKSKNDATIEPASIAAVNDHEKSKPILVVPARENAHIAKRTAAL